ncbi:Hypothetical predicted protein [Mytilus galloprovincialis]|uniref:Reverse transcriptase domain-containing protein n=1 Tax=Mytilus galloprovincialis TaxID=29158 RepID=A0A8B6DGL0_MYTGA|nr:Hypothetical predicted protein [Mytilus galloprovincialis]
MSTAKMKTRRAGHRGVLTKLLKKVEPSSEELLQEFDVSELSTIRGLIVKKQETIDQLNEKIVEELSEEEVSEEIEEADRYTYDIEMSVTKLSKIIKESEITDKQSSKSLLNPNAHEFINYTNHQESQPQPSFMHANTSAMYHKLPKLNLPTFGGNMLEWQPFWDSFSAAVHDNLSLNDVQKFNYLKSQLFGEATQCIAGLQITNTNYGQALHVLKQRFGQPHKIVQTYMQSLISLPSPTSNITHLKKFYDSMENYIRGLESIGESHESFGSLLVPIILNKLPGNIRENMVRAHGGDHWNLPSLRQAIQHEITIKEAVKPNYTPTSAFFTGTNRNYANQKGKRDITKKPCIFCQGVHAPLACKTVTEIEARKRIVKEKQACFNCLGNHRVADCKSDKTCKNCNKRHHTILVFVQRMKHTLYTKSKDSSTSKPDTDAAVASMHSSTSSVRSQVLLKTAIAPITYDKTHFNTANILFDEGAQRSFITQEMADLLNLRPHRKEAITISGFGESNKKLNKLTDILTRFRYGKYALTTDIEKAFLQIGLDEEDRDSTRFFWLRDPSNPKSELETYRFKVILFGATCSPFILNATLLKHLSTVTSATAEILKRDLYVDNVLTSVNTEEAALNFFEESRELMTNAGFNLRTWKSNSNQLSNEATKANVLDKDSETKILGMRWDAKSDILTFAKLNEDHSNPADLQTRGISSTQFKESTLWMQGPSWISDENSWPTWTPQVKQETLLLTTTDDSEKIKPCVLNGISKIIDLSRFSSLKKLLRVTCYVFKFVNICKSKRPYNLRKYARHGKDITKDEIDRATRTWITDIQNEKFSSEKQQLANPSHDKNLPYRRCHSMRRAHTQFTVRRLREVSSVTTEEKSIYGLNYIERAPADVAFWCWTDNYANPPIILDTFH